MSDLLTVKELLPGANDYDIDAIESLVNELEEMDETSKPVFTSKEHLRPYLSHSMRNIGFMFQDETIDAIVKFFDEEA